MLKLKTDDYILDKINYLNSLYNCKIKQNYLNFEINCNICNHLYILKNIENITSGCKCPEECHKENKVVKKYREICEKNKWILNYNTYYSRNTIYANCTICKLQPISMKKSIYKEKYCLCTLINENKFPTTIPNKIGICSILNYNNGAFKIKCTICNYCENLEISSILNLYRRNFYTNLDPKLLYDNLDCICYINFPKEIPNKIGTIQILDYKDGKFDCRCNICKECVLEMKYKYDFIELYKKNFYTSFNPNILYYFIKCKCHYNLPQALPLKIGKYTIEHYNNKQGTFFCMCDICKKFIYIKSYELYKAGFYDSKNIRYLDPKLLKCKCI